MAKRKVKRKKRQTPLRKEKGFGPMTRRGVKGTLRKKKKKPRGTGKRAPRKR